MFEKYNIVAILTAWKRDYFKEQLNSLINQTVKVDKIIILNNGGSDLSYLKNEVNCEISIIKSDVNTKFWGRHSIANMFNCEYILLLDDDTIPGSKWVENCLRLSNQKNCIVTGNGRSIDNKISWGDGGRVDQDMQVAFGGHSWFFKKEWMKYYLTEKPFSYDSGEDIWISALCKLNGGISTWMPEQLGETSAHKNSYADDQHASYQLNNWDNIRENICNHYIEKGWSL